MCRSITYRQLGNDKFKTGDDAGAFELYSKSILFAPPNSPEIALAYANRSATEFHLEHFKDCIMDINQAISHGYSEHGRYKLLARKGKCLMKLQKYIDAIKTLNEALNMLEKLEKVPHSKKIALKQDVQESLSSSLKLCRLQESSQLDLKEDLLTIEKSNSEGAMSIQMSSTSSSASSLPSLTCGESHILSCASNKIKMQTSNAKGRHVIAVEDVYKGDTLFVEKPVAFVILPPCSLSHCSHCCASISAPIPCNECILAVYCSEVCRLNSWNQYHRYECYGGLHLLESVGIAHLALKIILISSMCDRYKEVVHLETHLKDMRPEDLYQYVLTATLLTLYLENFTDYFITGSPLHLDTSLSLSNDVGHRMLLHIGQLICNGHAITKLGITESTQESLTESTTPECRNGEVVSQEQVRIATAIFPSASMMNHSCDPNIINSFSDQFLIVRAAKDIPSGTEVLNCYGPHFRRMRTEDRKQALSEQYHFDCVCSACCSPCRSEYGERSFGLLCPQCEGPLLRDSADTAIEKHVLTCSDCCHVQHGAKLIKMDLCAHGYFTQGMSLMNKGDISAALQDFLKCLDIRRQCLFKYNKDLLYTQDVLAKCYAMLGQYNKSIYYIEQCLEGVKDIYGETSIELSHELNKLTDVMVSNLQSDSENIGEDYVSKIREYIAACRDILELNYGTWNPEYKSVIEKQITLDKIKKKR